MLVKKCFTNCSFYPYISPRPTPLCVYLEKPKNSHRNMAAQIIIEADIDAFLQDLHAVVEHVDHLIFANDQALLAEQPLAGQWAVPALPMIPLADQQPVAPDVTAQGPIDLDETLEEIPVPRRPLPSQEQADLLLMTGGLDLSRLEIAEIYAQIYARFSNPELDARYGPHSHRPTPSQ